MNSVDLSDSTIQRIASVVVAMLEGRRTSDAVLTRAEAMSYVKRESQGGFCEWCKRWSVRPASRGRYSRSQLDVALSREARARPIF